MMEGFLHHYGGGGLRLKEFLSWQMVYTGGVPCDTFYVECPWDSEDISGLEKGMAFSASWEDAVVFYGVVDEFELWLDPDGRRLCLSGRGMAARLVDNEALGMEYQTATMEDILRDHVTPYGVSVDCQSDFSRASGFTVDSGSSEWQVLYNFAQYWGGITPRFDQEGTLILGTWSDGTQMVIDNNTQLSELIYRERRYGVLSQVLVRDKTRQVVETVDNEDFLAVGGCRRQVLTMPGLSTYQAMRYSGTYQIEQSEADWKVVEVTLPQAFAAWPGDLVQIARKDCGFNGVYRVRESKVEIDGQGQRTWLELGPR